MKLEIKPYVGVSNILFTDTKEQILQKINSIEIYQSNSKHISFRNLNVQVSFDENYICNQISVGGISNYPTVNDIYIYGAKLKPNFTETLEQLKEINSNYKIVGYDKNHYIFNTLGIVLCRSIEDVEEDEKGNEILIYGNHWDYIALFREDNNPEILLSY